MKPSTLFAGALLAVALATVGCDTHSQDVGAATSQAPGVLRMAEPAAALLRRMHQAPWTVAYTGTRRVEQSWKVDNATYTTIYREEVSADGNGRYAIDPLDLIAPQVSTMELQVFNATQKAREGFLYRYRDFHVQDEARFARYYTAAATGVVRQVAGRSCDELIVQRRSNAPWTYVLAVDTQTGLVLSCRQELPNGTPVGSMEFESVDFQADLSQKLWHQASNEELALARDSRAQQQLGFAPVLPNTDGGSFTLIESNKVTSPDPSGAGELTWAKYTLSDGVEVVFVLHGGALVGSDDVVRVSPSVGPWNHVEGTLHGERVMGMGRVSVDELLDLIASAF